MNPAVVAQSFRRISRVPTLLSLSEAQPIQGQFDCDEDHRFGRPHLRFAEATDEAERPGFGRGGHQFDGVFLSCST